MKHYYFFIKEDGRTARLDIYSNIKDTIVIIKTYKDALTGDLFRKVETKTIKKVKLC